MPVPDELIYSGAQSKAREHVQHTFDVEVQADFLERLAAARPVPPSRQTDDGPITEQLTLMPYDERVAERIRQAFGDQRGITERKMFGGLAFLSRGRMCCGIVGRDLMVRAPMHVFDGLLRRRHIRPMDFTGKPLRGFLFVSPSGFRTASALKTWLSYGKQAAAEMAERSRPHRRAGSARAVNRRASRADRSKRVR
jgi:hypothetical protein